MSAESIPCGKHDEDVPAVAILVYGYPPHLEFGEGRCAEHAKCQDGPERADIEDSEYHEAFCQRHADKYSGDETVNGPDVVFLDSERYAELVADGVK